jgi:hypothetical protein
VLQHFYYGRSLAVMPADLKRILEEAIVTGVEPVLDDDQKELITWLGGVAPGLCEAYATPEARDARLGLCAGSYAPYIEFIPDTYDALAAGGLTAHDVAVGHRIGEAGFEKVLHAIAGDIAARFLESGEQTWEIVVARTRFFLDLTGCVIGYDPVYGQCPSHAEYLATSVSLQREFGPRLNRDNKPNPSATGND